MVYASDCEEKNKAAFYKLIDKKKFDKAKNGDRYHLEYLYTVPDVVHIGKCCKGSFSNWWLIVDGYRINLSILRCLRQDFNLESYAKPFH